MTALPSGCKHKPREFVGLVKSVKRKEKKKSVSYSFAVAYEDVIIIHARVVVYYEIVLEQSD